MTATAAIRRLDRQRVAQRAYRQRVADGRFVEPIEIDEDLVDTLIRGGLLDPRAADDRKAVRAALVEQLRLLCRFPS